MNPRRELLLDRIEPQLICPACRIGLTKAPAAGGALVCPGCGRETCRAQGRFEFGGLSKEAEGEDWLNAIKGAAKRRLGHLYPAAIQLLSPVYADSGLSRFIRRFDCERDMVCDLGAGARSYDERILCVDGYAYESVHVVCDLAALPFADASIDGIVSEAVLEHVPDPAAHVAEMRRVLRPGGRVFCYFPFMVPYHASPHDYSRLTLPGLRHLFDGFTIESVRVAGGPTSGLLWTLQEWLAIVCSMWSERLYRVLLPITWLLSPLKYLDAILMRHPAAHVIASGFAIEAIKPL
jgi:SAM-dependent methyltransferase